MTWLGQADVSSAPASDGATPVLRVELDVSVEISARKADGFDDDKIRIISENAATLKFEQHGFETD